MAEGQKLESQCPFWGVGNMMKKFYQDGNLIK
jgi:hypothetical protein